MLDLAQAIVRLTGSHSRIVFQSLPADDPARRRPDIALAKRVLGWQPRVKLEAGLKRTVEYFANRDAGPERRPRRRVTLAAAAARDAARAADAARPRPGTR